MIEPLESRIAPAAVVLTATSFESKYVNAKGQTLLQFFNAGNTGLTGADLAIAKTVDPGQTATDVYFMILTTGESVRIPTTVGFQTLVSVNSGTVVAFFTDGDSNNVATDQVTSTDLSGLALGPKVSVAVGDSIYGDVVTDYNALTGTLGGSTEAAGHATQLLANTVTSLTIGGDVTGNVIFGGNVSKFEATGTIGGALIGGVLTGTAANNVTFSFDPVVSDYNNPNTQLSVPIPANGVAGPSLSDAIIGDAYHITLGQGGPGAAGGSVQGLTLLDNVTPITIIAGAGGNGAVGKTSGGKGGNISGVVFNGPLDISGNVANSLLELEGGAGGNGLGTAKGGAGGFVQNVYIDYASASLSTPSHLYLNDNIVIEGGMGGTGGSAGAGGSLNNVNVLTATTHGTSPEFVLLGGTGGSSTVGGKGGAGGSVTNSTLLNEEPVPEAPPILTTAVIEAGSGGSVLVKGAGGAGGAVSGLTLRGYNFTIDSGTGGGGVSSGGAGGHISSIDVVGSSGNLPGDDFHVLSLLIDAGSGGAASAGKGGSGGAVSALTVSNADFGNPSGSQINPEFVVIGGTGGQAGKGAGGAGGGISNVQVTEIDFLTATNVQGYSAIMDLDAGSGGAAPVAKGTGGAGGSMSNITVIGTQLISNVTTGTGGAGGASGLQGKGGAGGSMTSVSIRTSEPLFSSETTAQAGILDDPTANFTGKVQVGDTVNNTTTGAATTVTAVNSSTQLALAANIIIPGDGYLVTDLTNNFTGTGTDSTVSSINTLVDTNANFQAEGIQVGTIVEDLTNLNYNLANPTATPEPTTAVVTGIYPASGNTDTLDLSADIFHQGDVYGFPTLGTGTFATGNGGAGFVKGAGGAGGSIVNSSIVTSGTIIMNGGTGGAGGASGASGAGGSLNGDGAFSSFESASLVAGSAGATGIKGGAGGSVTGANVQVLNAVTIIGGNGEVGGAGGSIVNCGYSGVLKSGGGFNPPSGNIDIVAGTGGTSTTGNGGAGGSINTLTGFITLPTAGTNNTTPYTTEFVAGGGGGGVKVAGGGGSVEHVRVFGGGDPDVTFFIAAGDAGNASAGKTGATGGSVNDIGGGVNASGSSDVNFTINAGTDFNYISAGNGGNAPTTGGLGGSVSNVSVNATIGIMVGTQFGFDLTGAGGISAGAGGAGATAGTAGNVTNISANAIASIVAGHLNLGANIEKINLANKVDGIILNGTTAPSTVQALTFSFDGASTTAPLFTNSPAVVVAAALNALAPIHSAGGVEVFAENNGYQVIFETAGAGAGTNTTNTLSGDEPAPTWTTVTQAYNAGTSTPEIQNVQVASSENFTLTFNNYTTTPISAGASAATVQTALDALPSISGIGGVTVTTGPSTVNPSYNIAFKATAGAVANVVQNFLLTETNGTTTSTPVLNVQNMTFASRGDLSPIQLATANFVGSVYYPVRLAALEYQSSAGYGVLAFGDVPIDGLIAATDLTSFKNFSPEAYLTVDSSGNAVFVDTPTI
jgi:hypothetical protein